MTSTPSALAGTLRSGRGERHSHVDPRFIAVFTVVGGVVGFLIKWALPPSRKVASGEVSRAERDVQDAWRELERAKTTPGLDDDEKAQAILDARREALLARERMKDILDGLPL